MAELHSKLLFRMSADLEEARMWEQHPTEIDASTT